ncbi:MAG: TetR/AcrR family transcriptional regulator, partial [Desulfobulbia bacterium]
MSSSKSKIDPRAQRTKSKALAVAWDILLKEGADAVTHLRIAQQTGIGRNTLYRHWPKRENILIEAIAMGDI